MHIVHVHVHVLPGTEDAFAAASLENARNSLTEPGVARFDVVQEVDDPRRFVLVEVYRDEDAAAADELRQHRGAILGLHSLAISTPQIVAALVSSGIMSGMTKLGSVEPAAWTLRAASVPAMVAATLACRLGEF